MKPIYDTIKGENLEECIRYLDKRNEDLNRKHYWSEDVPQYWDIELIYPTGNSVIILIKKRGYK